MKESFTPPLCREETFQQDEQPPYFVVDLSSRSTSMIGSDSHSESHIDLRAGSIIRRKHQSKTRYLGCAPWLLLAAVLSFKFAILAGWLVREHYEFDYRCAFSGWMESDLGLRDEKNSKIEMVEHGRYNQLKRDKREIDDDPILDPRFSLTGRKRAEQEMEVQPVRTSGIQLLQSTGGSTIRTKTIRNRIETMPSRKGAEIPLDGLKTKKKKEKQRQPMLGARESEVVENRGDDDQIDRLRPPIRLPQAAKTPRIVVRESGEEKGKKLVGEEATSQIEEIDDDGNDLLDEQEKNIDETLTTTLKPKGKGKKKGKGKGKGKKGKGKKHKNGTMTQRDDEDLDHLDHQRLHRWTTKYPRHLVSPSSHQSQSSSSSSSNSPQSTPTPNHSPFLSGALDPHDPHFSNKGHIRGYAMKTASKKPAKLKISDSTRLMWHLDELNFTTLFPAGTVPTKEEASFNPVALEPVTFELKSTSKTVTSVDFGSIDVFEILEEIVKTTEPSIIHSSTTKTESTTSEKTAQRLPRTTTTTPLTTTEQTEAVKKEPILRLEPTIPSVQTTETNEIREPNPGDSFSQWKKKVEEGRRIQATMKPWGTTEKPVIRLDSLQVDVTETPRRTTVITRYGELPTSKNAPMEVKPGFDRRGDGDKHSRYSTKMPGEEPEKKPVPKSDPAIDIFGDNLQSFADSALCIVRTLFDAWCVIQCVCCVPSFLSVCFPSRSLFVVHLVLDVLFLVVAFIFCSTGVVFSVVLFVLVEGMGRETLLEWTFLLLLFFALLLVYTAVVVITHRCWELLLESSAVRRTYRRVEKANGIEAEEL